MSTLFDHQSIQYKATTDLFKKSKPNNETAHFDFSSGREEPYTRRKLYSHTITLHSANGPAFTLRDIDQQHVTLHVPS